MALVGGVCGAGCASAASGGGNAALAPSVQSYTDQAAPASGIPPQGYYDSPLAAGTLTLEDVLEAHKPAAPNPVPAPVATPSGTATAPLLVPPTQSSSTGVMMSAGMKAVLQKITGANGTPTPLAAQAVEQGAAVPSPATATPAATPAIPAAPVAVAGAPGLTYQPGQEPKNLAAAATPAPPQTALTLPGATAIPITPAASAPSSASPVSSCDQNVQKWEKSCSEAGYPATYVGKIVGETRTGCADGLLHDVWVSNSCSPPEVASSQTARTDAVCGPASNNEFDEAPTSNLCAQGIASTVSGTGPWTWACSGVNGGNAAACTAHNKSEKINGICGTANGLASAIAPATGLCDSGNATSVKGDGPWTWSCRGVGGGASQSCIAPMSSTPMAAAIEESSPAVGSSSKPVAAAVAASSSDDADLCGLAAETLAYAQPDHDLCRAGNASVVNGDGPWSWSCTDNEGKTSSCRTLSLNGDATPAAPNAAPETAVEAAPSDVKASSHAQNQNSIMATGVAATTTAPALACGPAASQPTMQAPTVGLCESGKAGAVRGSGPWHWNCADRQHHKISCETSTQINGSCGPANGTTLKSAPFAGLCAVGIPSSIEGNGPWNWVCNGSGGGSNVSCAAALQPAENTKVEGTCGPAANMSLQNAPESGLCASGTPSAVSGKGPWTWACSGIDGGGVSSCSAAKIAAAAAPGPAVGGLCGGANGVMAASAPNQDLCATGTPTPTVGNGPWNWNCLGENGGMSVSCTAPLQPPEPIDGACGDANGISTLVKPQSALCSSGITGTVSGKGPWTWTCSGANGGSPASCIAPVAGKTGAMPSMMTVASGTDSVAPAPSGLTTPQLPSSGSIPPLDKEVLPSLTQSKAFSSPPQPSPLPAAVAVRGATVPDTAPDLSDSQPVQPPALRDTISPAPVLQESASIPATAIPGNHLALDPSISTVVFQHGSSNIDQASLPTLSKLTAILRDNADVRITLKAYADNTGSTPRDARRLSLARALAIRDYLGAQGISDSRVDVRAEGANTNTMPMDRVDFQVNS